MLRSVILLRRRRWWWKTTSIGYNCPVICFEFAIPRKTHIICTANLSLLFFQVWQPLTLDLVLHSHLLCNSRYRRWIRSLTLCHILLSTDIITLRVLVLSMLLSRQWWRWWLMKSGVRFSTW
jgi:hypothetical protein